MLARTVMCVVITLAEKITLGSEESETAEETLNQWHGGLPESATVTELLGNK